jgi:RNA polymerase subunit RPABC4/transcription elongation factor Spt4
MADQVETWTPRVCLHCGRPTPERKWRCTECQSSHDAKKDGMRAVIAAHRRAESYRVHMSDTPDPVEPEEPETPEEE